jgi:hypothetical protein
MLWWFDWSKGRTYKDTCLIPYVINNQSEVLEIYKKLRDIAIEI